MLKTIHPLLTGELLAILADMGHGDEIVITDANFPAATVAQRLIRLPMASAPQVAEAVLSLLPLDDFVAHPAAAMATPEGRAPIHDDFQAVVDAAEGRPTGMELVDRFAFYDRTKTAFAVISSGERRLYGNLILKKGVLKG